MGYNLFLYQGIFLQFFQLLTKHFFGDTGEVVSDLTVTFFPGPIEMRKDEELPLAADKTHRNVDGTGVGLVAQFDHYTIYELRFGLVGTAGHPPIPAGHGFGVGNGVFGGLAVKDGDAAAPFQVADEGGAEFRVGGHTDLVGGVEEELHPSFALGFVEHFADVMGDHDGVTAVVVFGISFRAAEYFGDEIGDMAGMIGGHGFKDGTDEVVLQDFVVEGPEKVLEGGFAPGPLV